jgi:PAS domain S-box-containing protein
MARAVTILKRLDFDCPQNCFELILRVPASNNNSAAFVAALARALAPSTEAVTIADGDGYILFANDEVERVYRRSKESVLGQHPLTFCPKDFSRTFSKKIFEGIQQEGGWDGVVMNVDAKGNRFPILLRTVRIEFGGLQFIVSWAKPFPAAAPFKLSSKQAQCFNLLGQGLLVKEISGRLNISLSSVNTHLKRVKEAIEKAQAQTEATSKGPAQIDLAHLAVRCLEAGWNPTMKKNASLK